MRLASTPLRSAFLAILTGLAAPAWAEDLAAPRLIRSRLASGRVVTVASHRCLAELNDAVRVGDDLLVATAGGGLLRFDGTRLRLTAEIELEGEASIVKLGRGEGETAVAGLSDGRIARVEPKTLALTEVARVSEVPAWVGWGPAADEGRGGLVAASGTSVHDLGSGRVLDTNDKVTTALVDRAGRLWVGADKGEWGGRVARVDLREMTLIELPPPRADRNLDRRPFWPGIYGFVELRDGQVWAFGGSLHMGLGEARIERVDELTPATLLEREAEHPPGDAGPLLPITHILQGKDDLLILSHDGVFRVGGRPERWKRVDPLRIRHRGGRPGAAPAVRAAVPPRREGEPVLLATEGDGLVALAEDRPAVRVATGRLGAPKITRIENSAEGLLFLEADESPAWTLGERAWRAVDLAPPFEIAPDNDAPQFERDLTSWARTHVLVGPEGVIHTVSSSGIGPGTVVTARREEGRPVVLGRETSGLDVGRSHVTPDGSLWNAGEDGWLRRFSEGRWRRVATLDARSPSEPRALSAEGPPWMMFDASQEEVWRLDPGGAGVAPRLSLLGERDDRVPRAHAAAPWAEGTILLATDDGLRELDPVAGTVRKVDLPDPPGETIFLARDGLGRAWCGGRWGLGLAVPGARRMETFDDVPEVGRRGVTALAADPAREDGVVVALGSREEGVLVALGSRGVAFVSAAREP